MLVDEIKRDKLAKKLKEFSTLAYEIYWLWLENDEDYSQESGVNNYPFRACLKDVADDIEKWVESFTEELQSTDITKSPKVF